MVCDTDRGSAFVFDESKPETSFVINKNFNRFLLCLVIGLLGCGKATGVSEADQYFGTYMTDDGLTSAMTKGVSRKSSFDRERGSVAGR